MCTSAESQELFGKALLLLYHHQYLLLEHTALIPAFFQCIQSQSRSRHLHHHYGALSLKLLTLTFKFIIAYDNFARMRTPIALSLVHAHNIVQVLSRNMATYTCTCNKKEVYISHLCSGNVKWTTYTSLPSRLLATMGRFSLTIKYIIGRQGRRFLPMGRQSEGSILNMPMWCLD